MQHEMIQIEPLEQIDEIELHEIESEQNR